MGYFKNDPIYESNKREAGKMIRGILILIAIAITSCGLLGYLVDFKP